MNINLKEIYLKLIDEFHLRTYEDSGDSISNIPGDKNTVFRINNYVMAYITDSLHKPYINVAQSISCKNKDLIHYTNYLKISDWGVDDNTEKVLRMNLEVIQRKYNKIVKQLKANYEQKRLEKLTRIFNVLAKNYKRQFEKEIPRFRSS